MSSEFCEMSLRQTQELLRLTDITLQNICCRKFTSEELYEEAVNRVLGGKGKRGPGSILLFFKDQENGFYRGSVFNLKEGVMRVGGNCLAPIPIYNRYVGCRSRQVKLVRCSVKCR
jgi:hypothetical protein